MSIFSDIVGKIGPVGTYLGAGALMGLSPTPLGFAMAYGLQSSMAADRDYKMQKEFAKHGISWRAADARRAGINPLAALGAGGARYQPSRQMMNYDRLLEMHQKSSQTKFLEEQIRGLRIDNEIKKRQYLEETGRYRGSHGIEAGFAKMFKYTEMPPDKVIMTLTQEVSESMESDKFAMAMVNWLRGKEIAKGMTHLKPEFLKTMRFLRPPSNKYGYIYKYHRQGYWQLVKMRFPGDDGLFINPKVERKSKRKVLPPIDDVLPYGG